ncbi:MAG: helix-turn-helix transcriptional regulator [Agathobacter sp.]|nr:helix-turn-helix transcriptional regulator [Agathobacter sp.]
MEEKKFDIQEIKFTKNTTRNFSSGKFYQILLIGKGECHFQFEENWIYCNAEAAIFLKPGEKISMKYHHNKYPLELLSVRILPEYLLELSDETCDLEKNFAFLPLSKAMIHLDTRDTTLLKNVTKTVIALSHTENDFGYQLYEKNMLSILVILFLRSCISSDRVMLSRNRKNLVMDDIFRYIREHLTEDLSLETLEQQFYVSRYHLCREFKKLSGQTIHSYIVKSRLDLCKKYIESGMPIKEVYALGGFGGYNHFFRAFKKEYGMTPKEYYESLTE